MCYHISPACPGDHSCSCSLQASAEWLLMLCWMQKPSVKSMGCSLSSTNANDILIKNYDVLINIDKKSNINSKFISLQQ